MSDGAFRETRQSRRLPRESQAFRNYAKHHELNPGERKPRQGYNGYWNWDTWNVDLWYSNDEQLARQKESWVKNWRQKKRNGTFNLEMAEYAVMKYIVPEAKKHDPEIDPNNVNSEEIVTLWMSED